MKIARLGADPEVFLFDPTKGKHISVIGMIGADKWNPLQMNDLPAGFTIQEDNVALEFGIPPASTADEFVHHIKTVMSESLKYVATGLTFSNLSCTIFEKDQMEHPMAYVFGCEPDWSAWTEKVNKKPQPPHPLMRSAGGHIHVETDDDVVYSVKKMDLFLSVPLVLMDENGAERKQSYGAEGAFRKKPYGLEYRSPSNCWIFEDDRIRWVFNQTQRALNSNIDVDAMATTIQHCIRNNDAQLAKSLVKAYDLEVL